MIAEDCDEVDLEAELQSFEQSWDRGAGSGVVDKPLEISSHQG